MKNWLVLVAIFALLFVACDDDKDKSDVSTDDTEVSTDDTNQTETCAESEYWDSTSEQCCPSECNGIYCPYSELCYCCAPPPDDDIYESSDDEEALDTSDSQ